MNQRHVKNEVNILGFGRTVLSGFKGIIRFNPPAASFKGSPHAVHETLFHCFAVWRRRTETDAGFHGNGAGSAIPGRRAWRLPDTGTIAFPLTENLAVQETDRVLSKILAVDITYLCSGETSAAKMHDLMKQVA